MLQTFIIPIRHTHIQLFSVDLLNKAPFIAINLIQLNWSVELKLSDIKIPDINSIQGFNSTTTWTRNFTFVKVRLYALILQKSEFEYSMADNMLQKLTDMVGCWTGIEPRYKSPTELCNETNQIETHQHTYGESSSKSNRELSNKYCKLVLPLHAHRKQINTV